VRASLVDDGALPALSLAAAARARAPRDTTTLLALGEAFEAAGLVAQASRAYGSIADLEPHRADRLSVASARLAHLGGDSLPLALELARRAAEDRPDLPSSHHLLAMTLLQSGAYAEAFEVLSHALTSVTFASRMGDPRRVMADMLGLVVVAWRAAQPELAEEIDRRAILIGAAIPPYADTRLVVTWNTDPSNVWANLRTDGNDAMLEQASWRSPEGWGPVEYVTRDAPANATVVVTGSLPPSGEPTLGVVHVLTHDGRGHVSVDPRPFVLMKAAAPAPLGAIAVSADLRSSSGSRERSPSSRDGS
jgi:hypothetical protein